MKKLVRSHIYFGGDYTPGHVPRDGMAEDIRQIKKAADKSAYPEAVRAQCENWE